MHLKLERTRLVVAARMAALALVIVLVNPSPGRAQSKSFEVASIKPSDPGAHGVQIRIAPGGRFTASNLTVKILIQQAYGVKDFQITGAPDWVGSERYDIVAKSEAAANQDQLKLMLQSLLAERFKLTLHRETKELPIYALVVGKNGHKLKEAEASGTPADGPPGDGPRPNGSQIRMGRGQLTAQMVPISLFAMQLSQQLGRSVLDKTGLKGNFDFKLEWTPEEGQSRGMGLGESAERPPAESGPPVDSSGPSIFTAVQEQLGLKLEAQKGPVEILVIDRIEKATEN